MTLVVTRDLQFLQAYKYDSKIQMKSVEEDEDSMFITKNDNNKNKYFWN